MPIKFRVLGGGGVLGFSGRERWNCRYFLMGAGIFLIDGQNCQSPIASVQRTWSNLAKPFRSSTWNEC